LSKVGEKFGIEIKYGRGLKYLIYNYSQNFYLKALPGSECVSEYELFSDSGSVLSRPKLTDSEGFGSTTLV
jgi:hypothetical protein